MPVYVKEGVLFDIIAPGGFRILSAIEQAAEKLTCDLVITSGTDGDHSGPTDPHKLGKAYDVRSRDMSPEQKDVVLAQIMNVLGWEQFYGFVENPNQDDEHFHYQVAKGKMYP